MSKLNVDQKTIFDLLSDRKADFLIPDYQVEYIGKPLLVDTFISR